MSELRLGIPKGSLEKATIELFAHAGWNISVRSRNYFPSIDDDEMTCALGRVQEMGPYVANGTFDVGLTGYDWVLETGADVVTVCDLVYSKSSDKPARWVLVVRQDSPIKSLKDIEGKKISTELLGYTKRWLKDNNINAEVEFSWGATEAKVVEGLVDAVVEITETGTTIKANGLRIVCEVLQTHTVLIANKDSMADPVKKKKIDQIALLLQGALDAHGKVLIKLNAPEDKIEAIVNQLPSINAPTVSSLYGSDWLAVETVVQRNLVRDLIPKLKAAGAEGILELPLHKVI